MYPVQLRLTGSGRRSSDSFIQMERIPVVGDKIIVEVTGERHFNYEVTDVISYIMGMEQEEFEHPQIKDNARPHNTFVVAKRP